MLRMSSSMVEHQWHCVRMHHTKSNDQIKPTFPNKVYDKKRPSNKSAKTTLKPVQLYFLQHANGKHSILFVVPMCACISYGKQILLLKTFQ